MKIFKEILSKNKEKYIQNLEDLIRLSKYSTNSVQDYLSDKFTSLNCINDDFNYDPKSIDLVEEFANDIKQGSSLERAIVARHKGESDGKSLILFSHPDTENYVHDDGWNHDPFEPKIINKKLHGWGIADDLAGVAMMYHCLDLIKKSGIRLKGDLILVSAPSKNHARGIASVLYKGYTAESALYLHPAESGNGLEDIKAFTPGQIVFTLEFTGQKPDTNEPAHTAMSHLGHNPMLDALEVIGELKEYENDRISKIHHPLLDHIVGRSTNLLFSFFEYGNSEAMDKVHDNCKLGCALSIIPGEKLEDIMNEIQERVDSVIHKNEWMKKQRPELKWVSGVSSASTEPTSPIYQITDKIIEKYGTKAKINPLHTSSDIRNPIVQKGIPTVGFGPICGNLTMCNESNEWVDLEDYFRTLCVTTEIVATFCNEKKD
jgi:acetylornithine deacetylase